MYWLKYYIIKNVTLNKGCKGEALCGWWQQITVYYLTSSLKQKCTENRLNMSQLFSPVSKTVGAGCPWDSNRTPGTLTHSWGGGCWNTSNSTKNINKFIYIIFVYMFFLLLLFLWMVTSKMTEYNNKKLKNKK